MVKEKALFIFHPRAKERLTFKFKHVFFKCECLHIHTKRDLAARNVGVQLVLLNPEQGQVNY